MTQHIEHKMQFSIPADKLWEGLNDFGGIDKFAVTIDKSLILSEAQSGVGAKRKCIFQNGSSVVEEIVDYQEGKRIEMILSEYSMPLKSASAVMTVEAVDATTSDVSMSMDFVVKGGVFGWLMGVFMMRPIMKGVFKKLLNGLAYHVVTGKLIGNKLPSQHELATAIGKTRVKIAS